VTSLPLERASGAADSRQPRFARFREVFRYEFGYRVRSASTWAYAVFLFLIVVWGTLATADGGAVHANAPIRVAEAVVLFGGLFGLVVSAALFGDAAVRDVAAGMDPLLFTTRLHKAEFLGGRFLAALAINAIVIVALPLGHIVATASPLMESEPLGPFRLAAYIQPLLLFSWPNLVFVGAILFTIGTLSRQVVPVYLAAIGIMIGYVSAANYWGGIDNPVLSALGDPLGINALLVMNRYWTPVEQNARLVGFPSMLLLNRLLWVALAATVLVMLHRTFRFAHAGAGGRRRKGVARVDAPAERHSPVAIPRATGIFGLRTRLWQTLAVARRTFGDVVAGRAFRVVLVALVGCVLLMGWNVTETVFETSTWPVTHLVAGTVLSQRMSVIPWLIIVLFAGELVWKERDAGAAEIADAVPVPDSLALLGRFLALVAMIAAVLAALVTGGILMQALQGYYHFEPGLYARIVFGFDFAEYVLLGALVMTVHVLVNHKYVGHIVALLAGAFTKAASVLGFGHHLLVYNSDPGWKYSDMNGFGPFTGPYVWFKLYWASWALLLGVLAVLFWVRGRESGLRRRFALARARFIGPVARAAGVAMVLILGLGGFVFYNTNTLNEYRTREEAGAPQAEYEKRYARFEKTPQPMLTDAKLRVEIYPGEPAADLRGTYRLVNKTGGRIDSVHVYLDPDLEARSFSVDRAATPVLTDAKTGFRIFALQRALEPGDSLQLTFDVGLRQRGFPNSGLQTDVVRNGTYIDRRRLPMIGYQPAFELTGDATRKRFGLAPQQPMPAPNDDEARQYRGPVRNENLVHIEATVGTAADQTAITTGVFRRSWTENGRRYVLYESEGPIAFAAPFFSGRYDVLEDQWSPTTSTGQPVALQIFHHPAHARGVEPMIRGVKASLDYYTKNFGPYQFRQLRIVEVPPYSIFGHADPGTITFSEDAFFGRVKEGELDQIFYGAAHETAHQWQVTGAMVRGIGYLGESFANYSAVMVTEKTFGPEAARRAYAFHMERYLVGRGEQSREVSLLDVERQTYIMYRKGAIALLTLRDFLGEDAVNGALRRYLEKYRDAGPPYPTALDQYAELRAVTPDSLKYLLTDLFETVTLWDVKTERASVRPAGAGAYEVTLDLVARKTRADSVGTETEVPMNDLVEIGVFPPGENALGAPLYLQRHRIRSGKQSITVTVPRKPGRAGIDPYRKLIDRERGDNVVGVEAAAAAASPVRPSSN
jgi:ABC-2 type transport system permease protein